MTHVLFAIDPGVRGTGVAVLVSGVLVRATVSPAFDLPRAVAGLRPTLEGVRPATGKIEGVIEIPQIYPSEKQKGDPNDLISISVVGGAAAGWIESNGGRVTYVKPATWKGQAPKDVIHDRMRRALSVAELGVLDACRMKWGKTLGHNALDAAALGLWQVGRL